MFNIVALILFSLSVSSSSPASIFWSSKCCVKTIEPESWRFPNILIFSESWVDSQHKWKDFSLFPQRIRAIRHSMPLLTCRLHWKTWLTGRRTRCRCCICCQKTNLWADCIMDSNFESKDTLVSNFRFLYRILSRASPYTCLHVRNSERLIQGFKFSSGAIHTKVPPIRSKSSSVRGDNSNASTVCLFALAGLLSCKAYSYIAIRSSAMSEVSEQSTRRSNYHTRGEFQEIKDIFFPP